MSTRSVREKMLEADEVLRINPDIDTEIVRVDGEAC
jgi:hypothetical protein